MNPESMQPEVQDEEGREDIAISSKLPDKPIGTSSNLETVEPASIHPHIPETPDSPIETKPSVQEQEPTAVVSLDLPKKREQTPLPTAYEVAMSKLDKPVSHPDMATQPSPPDTLYSELKRLAQKVGHKDDDFSGVNDLSLDGVAQAFQRDSTHIQHDSSENSDTVVERTDKDTKKGPRISNILINGKPSTEAEFIPYTDIPELERVATENATRKLAEKLEEERKAQEAQELKELCEAQIVEYGVSFSNRIEDEVLRLAAEENIIVHPTSVFKKGLKLIAGLNDGGQEISCSYSFHLDFTVQYIPDESRPGYMFQRVTAAQQRSVFIRGRLYKDANGLRRFNPSEVVYDAQVDTPKHSPAFARYPDDHQRILFSHDADLDQFLPTIITRKGHNGAGPFKTKKYKSEFNVDEAERTEKNVAYYKSLLDTIPTNPLRDKELEDLENFPV